MCVFVVIWLGLFVFALLAAYVCYQAYTLVEDHGFDTFTYDNIPRPLRWLFPELASVSNGEPSSDIDMSAGSLQYYAAYSMMRKMSSVAYSVIGGLLCMMIATGFLLWPFHVVCNHSPFIGGPLHVHLSSTTDPRRNRRIMIGDEYDTNVQPITMVAPQIRPQDLPQVQQLLSEDTDNVDSAFGSAAPSAV